MVVACFIRLICALVSRARPLHIPRMHGCVYRVVECMCQPSDPSTKTRFTISSGNISSKIGATAQRSLRRLVGGYIDTYTRLWNICGSRPLSQGCNPTTGWLLMDT